MNLRIERPTIGKGALCAQITSSLRGWLGDPEATACYIERANSLQSFVARVDGSEVGILTVITDPPKSAEIVAMGVSPQFHRRGAGKALVSTLENHLCFFVRSCGRLPGTHQ